MDQTIVIILAIIIFFSKILSLIFSKIKLPPVLSIILLGLIAGPTGFNIIKIEFDKNILEFFSEMGVVLLLFLAGIETDIEQIKKSGKNATFIALGGVIIPLLIGFFLTYFFTHDVLTSSIMGLILTATSVSVSVMTLIDLNKLKTVEGNIIINSAIIDDIVGIILLSIFFAVSGAKGGGFSTIIFSFIGMLIYFTSVFLIGIFIIPFISKLIAKYNQFVLVLPFAFFIILSYAFFAEKFEIAAITGAYFAGVFFSRTQLKQTIEEGINTIAHTLFIPVFFFFIGFQTDLSSFNLSFLPYVALFVVTAFVGKLIGAGGTAKMLGFNWIRSLRIGSGMIPRGEVALIIATLALHTENPFISEKEFSAVIIVVILTTFVTPFLLKLGFFEKNKQD